MAAKLPVIIDDGNQYVYGLGLVEQVNYATNTPYFYLTRARIHGWICSQ